MIARYSSERGDGRWRSVPGSRQSSTRAAYTKVKAWAVAGPVRARHALGPGRTWARERRSARCQVWAGVLNARHAAGGARRGARPAPGRQEHERARAADAGVRGGGRRAARAAPVARPDRRGRRGRVPAAARGRGRGVGALARDQRAGRAGAAAARLWRPSVRGPNGGALPGSDLRTGLCAQRARAAARLLSPSTHVSASRLSRHPSETFMSRCAAMQLRVAAPRPLLQLRVATPRPLLPLRTDRQDRSYTT